MHNLLRSRPERPSRVVGDRGDLDRGLRGRRAGLIGFIGSIALAFKLYELERDSLYLAAAISLIASLVLSFGGLVPYAGPLISIAASALGFIALILLYAALGGSIARASSTTTPPALS
jgi:hypothetical protein